MKVSFADKSLERLAVDRLVPPSISMSVAHAYISVIEVIKAAPDESVLENLEFLSYRRLPGRGRRRQLKLSKSAHMLLRLTGKKATLSALVDSISMKGRSAA